MLSFDILDPRFSEKQKNHNRTATPEFQKQLSLFKFFMDLLMKFDIEQQIKRTMQSQDNQHLRTQR